MELKNKIVSFLGDSITEGKGVNNTKNRYCNRLKRIFGFKKMINYGVSGTRLAHQTKPSDTPRKDLCFCGRAHDINPKSDLIIVYGGVNDYIHGDAPIGKWGDVTPATFYGGVYYLMNLLKTNYTAKVVFISPARMLYKGISSEKPSTYPTKISDALPLLNYVEIIKKTGEHFGIPVLDLYNCLGIDPNAQEDNLKYTVDGLHFNDLGHGILANKIAEFLKSL